MISQAALKIGSLWKIPPFPLLFVFCFASTTVPCSRDGKDQLDDFQGRAVLWFTAWMMWGSKLRFCVNELCSTCPRNRVFYLHLSFCPYIRWLETHHTPLFSRIFALPQTSLMCVCFCTYIWLELILRVFSSLNDSMIYRLAYIFHARSNIYLYSLKKGRTKCLLKTCVLIDSLSWGIRRVLRDNLLP